MLSSYGGGHKKSEITFHWIVVLTPLCYISSEFFILFILFLIFIVTPCMLSSYSIITPATAHIQNIT